jgi:hypothetical protein
LATIRVEESSGPHGLQNPAIVACIQKLADKIFCTYVLLENEAEEEIKARHQHMLVEPPDRTAFRQSLGVGEHLDSLASLHCFGKNHGLDSQKNVYKSTGANNIYAATSEGYCYESIQSVNGSSFF